MATSTSVCAVCELQHQTTESTHWCIECEEPLCSDCRKYHNVLKATRNHKTISISDYKLIPSAVTDIKQNCVYHNEIYQLYCIKHESPICNKCVKDHGKCGEILSLDDIVRDIKTSVSFVGLDLFTNINLIRKDRVSNIECISDQKKKIAAHVSLIKRQVIQHVEKLEEEFIKELDQIEFDCCNKIHSVVSSLQDKANEINQLKAEIKNIKKYASDLQALLSMREVQAKTNEYEYHLQSSIEKRDHDNIKIESAIITKIQDVLMVDKFGSTKIKKSQSIDINLNKRKERQAQLMIPKEVVLINNVKLVFQRKLDNTCKYPNGCCVTKKGEFLFTDYKDNNEKVFAINDEGGIAYNIPLTKPHKSFDVASLDETTVAVSTGCLDKKPGISIVDLTKRKVIKFIALNNNPYGITYDGKSLICCVRNRGLYAISCTDFSITSILNTTDLISTSYCSTHADTIFFINSNKKQ